MQASTFRRLFAADSYVSMAVLVAIGALFWVLVPSQPLVLASCDGESPCLGGEFCCNGVCVPEGYVCCGDGSYGPGDQCYCCSGCEDSTCTAPSTLYCPDPAEYGY
jgi:hypothetical protein